jgi:hypothetical protein
MAIGEGEGGPGGGGEGGLSRMENLPHGGTDDNDHMAR